MLQKVILRDYSVMWRLTLTSIGFLLNSDVVLMVDTVDDYWGTYYDTTESSVGQDVVNFPITTERVSVIHVLTENSTKHEYWLASGLGTYEEHRNRCEASGGHLLDLRGPYTTSLLNQLVMYYNSGQVGVKYPYYIGLTRHVLNQQSVTDFVWYDGELETGDILAEYNYQNSGDNLNECVGIKYRKSLGFQAKTFACNQTLAMICQRTTENLCPFTRHWKKFLNTSIMTMTSRYIRRYKCRQLCEKQENCWYFVYNNSSGSCQIFYSDVMPRMDRFCGWLENSTDSDTYRRDCIVLTVYDVGGNDITYPVCPVTSEALSQQTTIPQSATSIVDSNVLPTDAQTITDLPFKPRAETAPFTRRLVVTGISEQLHSLASTDIPVPSAASFYPSDTENTPNEKTAGQYVTGTSVPPDKRKDQLVTKSVIAEGPDIAQITLTYALTTLSQSPNGPLSQDSSEKASFISKVTTVQSEMQRREIRTTDEASTIKQLTAGYNSSAEATGDRETTTTDATLEEFTVDGLGVDNSGTGTTTAKVQTLMCLTSCRCPTFASRVKVTVDQILESLTLNKATVSNYRRRYLSYPDDRISAACLGYLGVVCLVSVSVSLIILDAKALGRDSMLLFRTLRQFLGRQGN